MLNKIFQDGLQGDDRLGRTFDPLRSDNSAPYLLIKHPRAITEIAEDWIIKALGDPLCKGILFVKGETYGGIGNRDRARTLEDRFKHRIHFLSFALERVSQLTTSMKASLSSFFSDFEADKLHSEYPDWSLIDQEWPRYLVAAYMIARVIAQSKSPEIKDQLMKRKDTWEPILAIASREYSARTTERTRFFITSSEDAATLAAEIGKCLQSLA